MRGRCSFGKSLNFVIIDQRRFRIEAVLHGFEHLAGKIDLGTMGQVAAVLQAHAQQRIARLQQRQVYRRIGL